MNDDPAPEVFVVTEAAAIAGPHRHPPASAFTSDSCSTQPAGISSSHKRTSAAVRSLLPTSGLVPQQQQLHSVWAPHQPYHDATATSASGLIFSAKQSSHRRPLFAPSALAHNPTLPLYHINATKSSRSNHCCCCSNCWRLLLSTTSSSSSNSSCFPAGRPALILGLFNCFSSSSSSSTFASMAAALTGSAAAGEALTLRALAAGLLVGSVLCFSNMYFGLQTGWVTMGSLQSAILGYGLFQGLGALGLLTQHLTVAENVIVQTTAVATATMPLAAGLVGIIPALGLLTEAEHPAGPILLSPWQLLAWCSSLAFFGVFVAVPLRYQTIIREQLRFPSGTATASVIRTLHGVPEPTAAAGSGTAAGAGAGAAGAAAADRFGGGGSREAGSGGAAGAWRSRSSSNSRADLEGALQLETAAADDAVLLAGSTSSTAAAAAAAAASQAEVQLLRQQQWRQGLRLLLWCFAISGAYCLAAAWVKPLSVLPVFDWLGLPGLTAWGWVLQPSPGYIGQGMIMGPKTAWSMMAGAVVGWGVLGPNAKARGWAPGPIKDAETGAAGWLLWVSLGLLLGDCFSELGLLLLQTAVDKASKANWLGGLGSAGRHGCVSGSGLRSRRAAKAAAAAAAGDYAKLNNADPELGTAAGGLGASSSSGNSNGIASAQICLELSPTGSANGLQDADVPAGATNNSSSSTYDTNAGSMQQPQQLASSRAGWAEDGSSAAKPHGAGSSSDSGGWMLSVKFWLPGLLLSTALCSGILGPGLPLGMPLHEPLIAVVVALLVALLAVRALGQTDLNPVSGVGKISQLVFAVVSPGAVVPNLVAGAIAEAGAQQAGDLMQDFKTAHLLGVAPSSQLLAMLLGSAASVPLSVAAYLLYTSAWQVPGPVLPAPMALIWLNMAKLVNGGKLPDHVGPFCAAAAAIAAALPVLQHLLQRYKKRQQLQQPADTAGVDEALLVTPGYYVDTRKCSDDGSAAATAAASSSSTDRSQQFSYLHQQQQQHKRSHPTAAIKACLTQASRRLLNTWRSRTAVDWVLALLPSGVGFAVGMYLTANWTLPRVLGSIVDQVWLLLSPSSHAAFMMVTASGLVLGEGCASVVTAVLHAVIGR